MPSKKSSSTARGKAGGQKRGCRPTARMTRSTKRTTKARGSGGGGLLLTVAQMLGAFHMESLPLAASILEHASSSQPDMGISIKGAVACIVASLRSMTEGDLSKAKTYLERAPLWICDIKPNTAPSPSA